MVTLDLVEILPLAVLGFMAVWMAQEARRPRHARRRPMSDQAVKPPMPEREWKAPLKVFVCPPATEPPPMCDCGFVGRWQHRPWLEWHENSETVSARKAREGTMRPFLPGWWVIGGIEERCPGCGDIERFDSDHNLIDRRQDHARVLTFMAARR
jgi:hypothetical protein